MSLSVGIVGLPNVGKSTLFNALLKKQQAYAANFPFATIDPNVGVVPVSDGRVCKLAEIWKQESGVFAPCVFATVTFVDIAGLIEGAHRGEGLGNKFLSHIRQVDLILHVVRSFGDENIVREGVVGPLEDFRTVEMELMMADLETLEKQKEPKGTASDNEKERWRAVEVFGEAIKNGISVREVLDEENEKWARELSLLSAKPFFVCLNGDEGDLVRAGEIEREYAGKLGVEKERVVLVCAKVEEELGQMEGGERSEYLQSLGVSEDGLTKIIRRAYLDLGLISFFTCGEKEARAWTIKRGMSAKESAGVIHSDFEKSFIKADVISFEDFLKFGGWKKARELGRVRSEGKDYVLKDGDVVEFKVGV
jgi:GTP-binding protein YchF